MQGLGGGRGGWGEGADWPKPGRNALTLNNQACGHGLGRPEGAAGVAEIDASVPHRCRRQ